MDDPINEHRFIGLEKLINARLAAIELTAEAQRRDYERRFGEMVTDRREQNAMAANARIQAETAAATNRRNTALSLLTASVATVTVIVSILLHFASAVTAR